MGKKRFLLIPGLNTLIKLFTQGMASLWGGYAFLFKKD